jgi:hypothetical protein
LPKGVRDVKCPYCQSENAGNALVCVACSRDIAVPATLLAERDDLLRKREALREELKQARGEVEAIMRRRKSS